VAGGAFDRTLQEQIGLALWWVLLTGTVAGVLPLRAPSRPALAGLLLLGGLAAWTALSLAWTDSAGNTSTDAAKVLTYLAIFTVVLALVTPNNAAIIAKGLGAGIAAVAVLAVLSRLRPDWFPHSDLYQYFAAGPFRLAYPLNYWNGLAGLVAIAVPLVLWTAATSGTFAVRALAGAVLPALALTINLTSSRGGAIAAAVGVVLLVILSPARGRIAASAVWVGITSVALAAYVQHRDALQEGLPTPEAHAQGRSALVVFIVVMLVAGGGQGALGYALRRLPPVRVGMPSPGARRGLALAVLVAAVVGSSAVNLPGDVSRAWHNFKQPSSATPPSGAGVLPRLDGLAGTGRYQMWDAAIRAARSHPIVGIGAGTYEFYWARHGKDQLFVRDAHSLLLETMAELGVVGLLVLLGFFGLVGTVGVRQATRAVDRAGREAAAAGTAAFCAFAVAVGLDWSWEITVVPAVGLALAATLLGTSRRVGPARSPARRLVVAAGVVAIPVIAIVLAATTLVGRSQEAARAGQLAKALSDARTAVKVEPVSAAPRVQEALVLERLGQMPAAISAMNGAIRRERVNWQLFLTRARLLTKAGRPEMALVDFERARQLAPRASVFGNAP
jgi:hypothetical protein